MIDTSTCKNVFGTFKPDAKRRIAEFVNNPNTKTWDNACHIIIGGTSFFTIWQAVIELDPTFPRVGRSEDFKGRILEDWKRIPSIELFERAVRYGSR